MAYQRIRKTFTFLFIVSIMATVIPAIAGPFHPSLAEAAEGERLNSNLELDDLFGDWLLDVYQDDLLKWHSPLRASSAAMKKASLFGFRIKQEGHKKNILLWMQFERNVAGQVLGLRSGGQPGEFILTVNLPGGSQDIRCSAFQDERKNSTLRIVWREGAKPKTLEYRKLTIPVEEFVIEQSIGGSFRGTAGRYRFDRNGRMIWQNEAGQFRIVMATSQIAMDLLEIPGKERFYFNWTAEGVLTFFGPLPENLPTNKVDITRLKPAFGLVRDLPTPLVPITSSGRPEVQRR